MSDLIPLICSQCRAHIKVSKREIETLFVQNSKNSLVFIGGAEDRLECDSCGTRFVKRDAFKRANAGNVSIETTAQAKVSDLT